MALCLFAATTSVLWQFPAAREPVTASVAAWSPTSLDTPIRVLVVGHEYFWRFRFPGPDAEFNTSDDVRVENELHLPVERDIEFLITSDDYVYTFAIPELDLRQIAIPELTYHLTFRIMEERSLDITADPLCGVRLFHDEHMGKIVVERASTFDSWYETLQ